MSEFPRGISAEEAERLIEGELHQLDRDNLSAIHKNQCVERELRFRRVIYAKRVERGAMTAKQAAWEIGCMEAIASDYRLALKSGGNYAIGEG